MCKTYGKNIKILWNPEKLTLSDLGDFERQYFVRMPADAEAKAITAAFGAVEMVSVEGINEKAFITGVMKRVLSMKQQKRPDILLIEFVLTDC